VFLHAIMSYYQVCQMTKNEYSYKKYGLLTPKIAASNPWLHILCGSGDQPEHWFSAENNN
jgi:hypothetical protein